MFKFLCVILFLSALYISGEAHAILRVPQAWSTNPSKASPCGGANTVSTPEAAWKIGSVVNITWQVIAADGAGTVSISYDTNAAQNFQSSTSQIGTASAVGTYVFQYTVPNLNCANGICTAQVASSSSWFSCTTVQLTQNNPPPVIPPAPTCTLVNGLNFCSQLNGQFVMVPPGQTPAEVDTQTLNTYNANFGNPKVFSSNSTDCAAAYQTFLCHNDLPYCPNAGACQTLCGNALAACQVTAEHAALYNCATGPQSCCQNNTNTCTPPATYGAPSNNPVGSTVSFTPVNPSVGGVEMRTFFLGLIVFAVLLLISA